MLARNVLIFHSAALGDFVLSWPLALALGRLYPQSRIVYVTHGDKGVLVGKVLGVEASDVESGWSALFADANALPMVCRKWLAGAHLVVCFAASQSETWLKNVQAIAGHAVEIIPVIPRPDEPAALHVSQHLLQQLHKHPVIQSAMRQTLSVILAQGVKRTFRGDTVVLHPGSGSPGKCWPIDRFLNLADKLNAVGVPVRIVLGEVERERWPAEIIKKCRNIAPVAMPASYTELLAELESAAVFVGNDSGPGHLAAIIGLPTLSLFGPTSPLVWKPLGPNVQAIQADLANLPVDLVYENVVRLITEAKRQACKTSGGKRLNNGNED